MKSDELLNLIYQNTPELKNALEFQHILYNSHTNTATAFYTSQVLVCNKEFLSVKKTIKSVFPRIRFELRIATPALAQDFMDQPDKYKYVFIPILVKRLPAIQSWIQESVWISERDSLVLEFPDLFSLEHFKQNLGKEYLLTAIEEIFLIKPPILMRVSGDTGERIRRITLERELFERSQQEAFEKNKAENVEKDSEESFINKKIKGRPIAAPAVPISELNDSSGKVVIAGRVFDIETKETKSGDMVILSFILSDLSESIKCKTFLRYRNTRNKEDESPFTEEEIEAVNSVIRAVKAEEGLIVRGECKYDDYDKALTVSLMDINALKIEKRKDLAEKKRVELHAHTHMSNMDGLVSVEDLINRAAEYGHPAIAITDHGVVQAFPGAFAQANKKKIKLIPGMEAYMIDQVGLTHKPSEAALGKSLVVLDFETTGLNPFQDRIIEIGAVRIENGAVVDSFSSFVDPQQPLRPIITKKTNINDSMLIGQPLAKDILPKLMDFIGDSMIAAHNAPFDTAFLREELKRMGRQYQNGYLDTLVLVQKLYPHLTRYRLGAMCKFLGVSLKNAHRALDDAMATALCLIKMLDLCLEKGIKTYRDIDLALEGNNFVGVKHVNILVANQTGMYHLNQLVSIAHTQHFHNLPLIPKSEIAAHREGLLLGSACFEGEIYQALFHQKPDEEVEELARFYDFLEIQPEENYLALIKKGEIASFEDIRRINLKILALGEKLGIPVVATGDSHFLDPEDSIFRSIVKSSQKSSDEDDLADEDPLYFKTTDEMLQLFSYLGKEKAEEIVINNPRKIMGKIGEISLYPKHPENKTTFLPVWETAADDITRMSYQKAEELYGVPLPEIVEKRIEKELKSIVGYGFATLYSIAHKLVTKSQKDGYMVGSRGSVGSSLVATLTDITEVNPLPPHYRCPQCRHVEFNVPQEYRIGKDLPSKECPNCGTLMARDGYDIPFEVFLGFEGDKVPDIDLNFSSDYRAVAHAYVEELFGQGYVYRAGTIGTLQNKTAYGFVSKYLELKNKTASDAHKNRLANGCVNVKRSTGQHPGGLVVLPKEYDINQFTAVQYPADDKNSNTVTTHYDFGSMHDILVKLDILGHDDPTMIHRLEQYTGIQYQDIPLDDKQVLSLFKSLDALKIRAEDLGSDTGTLGIPEFGTNFVRKMLADTKPTRMEDLIRISGLSHGTDVWTKNAQDLLLAGTATLRECICTRDDIMLNLIERGLEPKMSFNIMESVRKGKGLNLEMERAMTEHEVPKWFIDSCKKIKYMFPKGHAVAYVTMALRVGWYKIYQPLAYYAAYFTVRGQGFDPLTMIKPPQYLKMMLEALTDKEDEKNSETNKDKKVALELALEMGLRGFSFLPVDLYKSDANRYLIEGEALRVPFSALSGFGEKAVLGIIEARNEQFTSIEDFKKRTLISKTGLQILEEAGALRDLPQNNQLDFFGII